MSIDEQNELGQSGAIEREVRHMQIASLQAKVNEQHVLLENLAEATLGLAAHFCALESKLTAKQVEAFQEVMRRLGHVDASLGRSTADWAEKWEALCAAAREDAK